MSKNKDYCKRYRTKLILGGLCVYGCGQLATRPSGLCEDCHDANHERIRTHRKSGGEENREAA